MFGPHPCTGSQVLLHATCHVPNVAMWVEIGCYLTINHIKVDIFSIFVLQWNYPCFGLLSLHSYHKAFSLIFQQFVQYFKRTISSIYPILLAIYINRLSFTFSKLSKQFPLSVNYLSCLIIPFRHPFKPFILYVEPTVQTSLLSFKLVLTHSQSQCGYISLKLICIFQICSATPQSFHIHPGNCRSNPWGTSSPAWESLPYHHLNESLV